MLSVLCVVLEGVVSDDAYLSIFILGAALASGSVLLMCLEFCCGDEIKAHLCANAANSLS